VARQLGGAELGRLDAAAVGREEVPGLAGLQSRGVAVQIVSRTFGPLRAVSASVLSMGTHPRPRDPLLIVANCAFGTEPFLQGTGCFAIVGVRGCAADDGKPPIPPRKNPQAGREDRLGSAGGEGRPGGRTHAGSSTILGALR